MSWIYFAYFISFRLETPLGLDKEKRRASFSLEGPLRTKLWEKGRQSSFKARGKLAKGTIPRLRGHFFLSFCAPLPCSGGECGRYRRYFVAKGLGSGAGTAPRAARGRASSGEAPPLARRIRASAPPRVTPPFVSSLASATAAWRAGGRPLRQLVSLALCARLACPAWGRGGAYLVRLATSSVCHRRPSQLTAFHIPR